MEPIGLAIGVVSLVGVFKECVDLFSLISATSSLGSDFEILNAKLDVEKTLLLQWAQRVRLLQPGYDERLNHQRTATAVSATLSALRSLLSKTEDLQRKYGLRLDRELEPSTGGAISTVGKGIRSALVGTTSTIVGPEITPIISGPRMTQFLSDFDAFNRRVKTTQKQASLKKRLLWVVRDRESFSLWIQQISDFVGRLNAVIPPRQDSDAAVAQLVEDIENINSIGGVQLVLSAAKEIDDTTADSADRYMEKRQHRIVRESQYRILDCLHFSTINDRIRSVTAAHTKTLQWLLNTTRPSSEIKGDSIAEWLESGSGVYWISGKAGSGKSTLMKHLFWELEETGRLLETWAGDKELITAAFFFWHLGTPEQKTKEGLFRSLLYTILDADPTLIPHMLPDMWEDAYAIVNWREREFEEECLVKEIVQHPDEYANEDRDQAVSIRAEDDDEYIGVQDVNHMVEETRTHAPTARRIRRIGRKYLNRGARPTLKVPSTRDMVEAFQRLKKKQTRHKFCFFIDGLDEYAGDHLSGTDIIQSLASNDNQEDSDKIKIIVSSRPIPACVQAFSRKRKLQLHDITRGDIEAYVDDTIRSHEYITKIRNMDEACVGGILSDLVEKASGVFLWVVVACRSLLEGFAAYDYPQELRRRVDELPPELELLFQHMLDKMEKRYQQLAAKLLRVCYQARLNEDARRQTWAADSTAPRRIKPSADDETVLGLSTIGLALLDEYGFDLERLPDGRALSGHEIYAKCEIFDARLRSRCCGLLETRGLETLADSTVEFMHRSVFEFLSSENVLNLRCLQIDEGTAKFEPNAVLSRMYLHVVPLVSHAERLKACASGSLVSLRYSMAGTGARMSMLQQFSGVTFGMIKKMSDDKSSPAFFKQITGDFPRPSRKSETTLALLLAAELGMTEVVLRYAVSCSEPSKILYHAVGRPYTRCLPIWRLPIPPEMIRYLLSGPEPKPSPNERFDNPGGHLTPWTCWLRHMQQSKIDSEPASAIEEITRLFVEAGADVTARLPNGVLHNSLESLVRWRILEAGSGRMNSELLEDAPAHPLAERCDDILGMVKAKRYELRMAEAKRRQDYDVKLDQPFLPKTDRGNRNKSDKSLDKNSQYDIMDSGIAK